MYKRHITRSDPDVGSPALVHNARHKVSLAASSVLCGSTSAGASPARSASMLGATLISVAISARTSKGSRRSPPQSEIVALINSVPFE